MASIRKRGSNSYLIVVSRGYDYEGNRLKSVQKTVKPPKEYTPKQAEKWVKEQAILFEREVQHTPEPINRKLTRANKSITLKALAPYYYRERALGHSTQEVGKLILKIDSLPADKRASFSAEEIHLMRTTVNQLRNERLAKGQYTDAADDMLLKLF